jgi:hypothetical protein
MFIVENQITLEELEQLTGNDELFSTIVPSIGERLRIKRHWHHNIHNAQPLHVSLFRLIFLV